MCAHESVRVRLHSNKAVPIPLTLRRLRLGDICKEYVMILIEATIRRRQVWGIKIGTSVQSPTHLLDYAYEAGNLVFTLNASMDVHL